MSSRVSGSVSRPVNVSVLASESRSWSRLGRIDERLNLGLGIEGLGLGIGLGQLGLVHIPGIYMN